MKKKMMIWSVLLLLVGLPVCAQALDFTDLDISIGKVRVPKDFIHSGKEYQKGNYWVQLIAKEGIPYFNVFDQKKELLFEELAVLIPLNNAAPADKPWHRVTKKLMNGQEYFRIKVLRPDSAIIAYLLIKAPPPPAETAPPATTTEPEKTEESAEQKL